MTKVLTLFLLASSTLATAQTTEPVFPASGTDRPDKYVEPTDSYDYVKRTVEIPIRDGVKLHTVIVEHKGAKNAPIVLNRTPYDADGHANRIKSGNMKAILPQSYDAFADAGYIVVFQDVRGQHNSEGGYVMNRPPIGPLPRPTRPCSRWRSPPGWAGRWSRAPRPAPGAARPPS